MSSGRRKNFFSPLNPNKTIFNPFIGCSTMTGDVVIGEVPDKCPSNMVQKERNAGETNICANVYVELAQKVRILVNK